MIRVHMDSDSGKQLAMQIPRPPPAGESMVPHAQGSARRHPTAAVTATAAGARLVLDTNVVLDLVVFRDPGVQAIAQAMRCGAVAAVTSYACKEELRRVLAYPQLKLDAPAQSAALDRYLARATLYDVTALPVPAELPLCTDTDDQKFLELAWHANARWLVTKDKAVLALAGAVASCGRFVVLQPEEFEQAVREPQSGQPPRVGFSCRTAPGPLSRAR
jgi:putative PIN family toxin of toxin-antitoxin system